MAAPLLALEGLTKSYGAVRAVAPLDLSLAPGEICALVGENGAGKSTIVNMVGGMTQPTGGTIRLDGAPVTLPTAREAHALGIGVVHQHYALVPGFTVAETLALGEAGPGRLDRRTLRDRVARIADDLGVRIDPDARIGSLDVAGQQRVEILRALSRDIRLLVLDEPTAVLSPEDGARLFAMVERLRDRGLAVLLVTHKLDDVLRVCDRAAVLHAGRLVADRPVAGLDPEGLVSLIITGKEGSQEAASVARAVSDDFGGHGGGAPAPGSPPGAPRGEEPDADAALSARDLVLRRANGSVAVEGVSFDLRPGEILAVAGVDGNGQSELMQCLAGLARPAAGHITMGGHDSRRAAEWTPGDLRRAGLAHIPEDRRRQGIGAALSLTDNMVLSHLAGPRYRRGPFLDRARARRETEAAIDGYDIRATGHAQAIGRLSGGNQQKLVLARELLGDPPVLLAAHPSRGLDVRTIAVVQERLRAARSRGGAVLLVSADMGEILRLADWVMVFAGGACRGPVPVAEADATRLGHWMTGHAA